ncbi:CsbD family protein [Hydrocarboniphaga effusa]|uniref:CsbD family protein n=1 Tax=Hydrocarboniphaga effusa TaxID=243629 RepID=UPI0035B168CD
MSNYEARSEAKADKAKGHSKEFAGKVKEKVGDLIGDDEMAARGTVQRADGKKDRLKGEIKDKVEDVKVTAKAGVEAVKDKLSKRH